MRASRVIAWVLPPTVALGALSPALAQDAPSAARAREPARPATQSESPGVAVDEVVVTAQKREERLLDTPISIAVIGGQALDRSSTRSVSEALTQIAGVNVEENVPGKNVIVMRGVSPGIGASTVAYYQDEVPFGFNRTPYLPDTGGFDLQRVEVLRGPQGTLYGASALSGVVRALTNDADLNDYELKGRARLSDTSRGGGDNYAIDLAGNAPLIPGKLAIRGVVGNSELSGFLTSAADGSTQINKSRIQQYRLKVNWQATDRLNVKAGYSRSAIRSDNPSDAFDNFQTPFPANEPDRRFFNLYSLVEQYDASKFTLLSATSYSDYYTDNIGGQFVGTTQRPFTNQDKLNALTQEIRLNSKLDGPWQWSAGVYYRDTKHKVTQTIPGFPAPFIQGDVDVTSAVFGELSRSFADDRFELLGGLRYFRDRSTIQDLGDLFNGPLLADQHATFEHTTGRIVLNYKPHQDLMFYGSVSTGFRSGAIQTPAIFKLDPRFPNLNPDTIINYEVGSKGALFDRSFVYETAVYYTDWNNLQQILRLPIGFSARVNSGEAAGWGAEASATYNLSRQFSLHGSLGWNGLKLQKDVISNGVVLFRTGDRVNNSQEWTASVGGTFRTPIGRNGAWELVASTDYSYGSEESARLLSGTVLTVTNSDNIGVLKAAVGVEAQDWSLTLFADNLLNERGALTPPDPNRGFIADRLRPLTLGVQLGFHY